MLDEPEFKLLLEPDEFPNEGELGFGERLSPPLDLLGLDPPPRDGEVLEGEVDGCLLGALSGRVEGCLDGLVLGVVEG